MAVTKLLKLSITVADLGQVTTFYREGLGLVAGPERAWDDPARIRLLGLDAGTAARSVDIAVGAKVIELVAFDPPGDPYPRARASNDQWFEHVALVAGDIEAAWEKLEATTPETITKGIPDLLPPDTGSVTAFKFRDPEGHPLELIAFPAGVGDPVWQEGAAAGIRGYDHTAISVTDVERSLAFYQGLLGFGVAGRSLNQGPAQDRLDGLPGCVVDVVALRPAAARTPHVELLHYRTPPGRALSGALKASDVASGRQVHKVDDLETLATRLEAEGVPFVSPGVVHLQDGQGAASVRDPDGHMIILVG